MENHITVVRKLLEELGCGDKPVIGVFNKTDIAHKTHPGKHGFSHCVSISAKSGEGLNALIGEIEEVLPGKKKNVKLLIPYSDGAVLSAIHEGELVKSVEYTDEGTVVEALLDNITYERYKRYALL